MTQIVTNLTQKTTSCQYQASASESDSSLSSGPLDDFKHALGLQTTDDHLGFVSLPLLRNVEREKNDLGAFKELPDT